LTAGLAEIEGYELRVQVGDVDERDVAQGLERQQVGLRETLLCCGARQSAARDRRRGSRRLDEVTPREHPCSACRMLQNAAAPQRAT